MGGCPPPPDWEGRQGGQYTAPSSRGAPQGSPAEYLHKPLVKYLEARGVEFRLGQRVRDIAWEDRDGQTLATGFRIGNDEVPGRLLRVPA